MITEDTTRYMIEQFVPHDLALELFNLGFDETCFTNYDPTGNLRSIWNISRRKWIQDDINMCWVKNDEWDCNSTLKENHENCIKDIKYPYETQFISAPLWQQVWQWFKTTHNITCDGIFYPDRSRRNYFVLGHIYAVDICESDITVLYDTTTYYDAQIKLLEKFISIVKKHSNGSITVS